jgi:hypothetical protein
MAANFVKLVTPHSLRLVCLAFLAAATTVSKGVIKINLARELVPQSEIVQLEEESAHGLATLEYDGMV